MYMYIIVEKIAFYIYAHIVFGLHFFVFLDGKDYCNK